VLTAEQRDEGELDHGFLADDDLAHLFAGGAKGGVKRFEGWVHKVGRRLSARTAALWKAAGVGLPAASGAIFSASAARAVRFHSSRQTCGRRAGETARRSSASSPAVGARSGPRSAAAGGGGPPAAAGRRDP